MVHRQAQPASQGLAAFAFGAHLAQVADLEDVGVVPAFAQGGMTEDEAQGFFIREQLLFILHDLAIDIIIRLGGAVGVFEYALFVLRKISIMQFLDGIFEPLESLIARVFDEVGQRLFKYNCEFTFNGFAALVVIAIVGHAVNEEQTQHFDAAPAHL